MATKSPSTRTVGSIGEKAVASYLRRRGYRILAQNYTVKGGELDLVVTRFSRIAFVEVKTRKADTDTEKYGRPRDAVDADKIAHLRHAATRFLSQHPTKKKPRFDIAEVFLFEKGKRLVPKIVYVKEAF